MDRCSCNLSAYLLGLLATCAELATCLLSLTSHLRTYAHTNYSPLLSTHQSASFPVCLPTSFPSPLTTCRPTSLPTYVTTNQCPLPTYILTTQRLYLSAVNNIGPISLPPCQPISLLHTYKSFLLTQLFLYSLPVLSNQPAYLLPSLLTSCRTILPCLLTHQTSNLPPY